MAIVAVGMIVIVAMVGLVIDVGYGWGQERDAQNGADAAAHAGAIVVLDKFAGADDPVGGWDQAVHTAVQESATQNGISVPEAIYTDWQGIPVEPPLAVGPSDGWNELPPQVQGVAVVGRKIFQPFLAQVLGFTSFTVNTRATAVAGNIADPCELEDCTLLPIAFPVTWVTCTDNGQDSVPVTDDGGQPLPWPEGEEVIMPLCGGNPGSVGWIDWSHLSTTEGCSGTGTAELVCHVESPPITDIPQPSWQYITDTGGVDSLTLENAINEYAGQLVLLPLFDATCRSEPSNPEVDGCPPEDSGAVGVNQWYHIPEPGFAAFRFDYPKGAYINGSNPICDTGNGATDCLIGTFVNYVGSGTVVEGNNPDNDNYGVQLVR
jgi:hypothetical protein